MAESTMTEATMTKERLEVGRAYDTYVMGKPTRVVYFGDKLTDFGRDSQFLARNDETSIVLISLTSRGLSLRGREVEKTIGTHPSVSFIQGDHPEYANLSKMLREAGE